ncbi:IclR family transcriptional regulator [Pseudemcibacter aquimaris]|uniref:IclR family transcriptional regulator n=1 Tax=Pseudemcibacter aquimaris TaxID=2857064 RepID=UPI002013B2E2|nr:IclR family transcriptional regulator [Pseudemcibacter aquimaris]MCC3862424.1 IclR family transcriptional regulator [Pseudemcibacter aquimaris]WDU59146.1 IclR family transcriptional regulator [Pseudemcibacter aquimaris]
MSKSVKGAASFSKNMAVLKAIADAGKPLSVPELVESVAMPRPTVYRFIAALEAEQLIEQTVSGGWQLSLGLLNLASKVWQGNDIRQAARPFLDKLRDQTGETVHLAIRSGNELTYIEKVESRESVKMTSTIGARVPFHSSSVGKAYLMAMDNDEREKVLWEISYPPITSHSVTSREQLEKQLDTLRQAGYVMEREENEEGVACYGEAILNSAGKPVAAISVSIPLYRLKPDHHIYTAPLAKVCQEISLRLPPC